MIQFHNGINFLLYYLQKKQESIGFHPLWIPAIIIIEIILMITLSASRHRYGMPAILPAAA
jgi:hypothetical protein